MSLSMQYSNSFIIRHTPFYESHNHHLAIELSYSFFYLLHSLESFESIQRTIRIAYIIYQFDLNAWIFGGCCRFAESSWIIPNSMTGIFRFFTKRLAFCANCSDSISNLRPYSYSKSDDESVMAHSNVWSYLFWLDRWHVV